MPEENCFFRDEAKKLIKEVERTGLNIYTILENYLENMNLDKEEKMWYNHKECQHSILLQFILNYYKGRCSEYLLSVLFNIKDC